MSSVLLAIFDNLLLTELGSRFGVSVEEYKVPSRADSIATIE